MSDHQPETDGPPTPFELGRRWLAATAAAQQAGLKASFETARVVGTGWARMWGLPTEEQDADADRRFRHAAWRDNPAFDTLRQLYLVGADWLAESADALEELDPALHERGTYFAGQLADAACPANWPLSNPEVLEESLGSGGANFIRGARNLVRDLRKGRISHVPEGAFELGRDLAATPGKVVHRNELMELIQYSPTTEAVHARPLLVIPPWINKYYVMDLQPHNSMFKYLVDSGFTVFAISWKNPGRDQNRLEWNDYTRLGPLAALDAVTAITGDRQVNAIGYCLGGLVLETTLAYLAASRDQRIASATFFTLPQDFANAGAIDVFINGWDVLLMEWVMAANGGFLEGANMALTFNLLRANDLVWPYVVNNYLLGRDPEPMDILHWSSDGTRQPAPTHSFLVRKIFLERRLEQPGGLEILGTPIDVGDIDQPCYSVGAFNDHIIPWRSAHAIHRRVGGPVRFVLAESGHIAGIINPPEAGRRGYWTNDEAVADPDAWFDGAEHHKGSWWPDWVAWLRRHAGNEIEPPPLGGDSHPPLDDAPGVYVRG
jgi:polyhydroxyalkanoate synthase